MAKATIAGLTVAIGANTDAFQKAIKEVDRISKNIANDLKNVSTSLKLDPTMVANYVDKFKLLQEAVDVSAKKVKLAQDAISALNKDFAEKKVSPEDYSKSLEALQRQLESSQYEYQRNVSALRDYDKEIKNGTASAESLAGTVEQTGKTYKALYEETSSANDQQKQLTDTIYKANKEYLLFYESTSKAADGEKELTDTINQANKSYDVYYEQTSKASDGQKQLSENTGKAHKSYLMFYEQTNKVIDGERQLTGEIDRANRSYNVHYEQTSKDASAQRQLSDSTNKTNKSYMVFYEQMTKATDADRELTDALYKTKEAEDQTAKSALSLGDIIKGNLISDAIKSGLHAVADAARKIGTACLNALKDITKGIVSFTKDSLAIAEENKQTLAKVGQVYGENAQQVIEWSKKAVDAFGLTSGKAQEAAAVFGNMFVALGLGTDKAADMSTNMVQLAADVAAFNNTTTTAVLEDFQSMLAGTSRQVRKYGIVLTEAAVKEKAVAMGLAESTDEVSDAAKAQARYQLMVEQTTHQVGQFARESDSATVQTQKLTARIQEIQGELGAKLLPVQARLYELVYSLISNPAVMSFVDSIIGKVGDLAEAFNKLLEGVNWDDLNGTFGDVLSQIVDKLMEVLPDVMEFGKKIIENIIEGINKYLPLILAEATPIITTLITGIIAELPTLAEGALQILQTIIDAIVENLELLSPAALDIIKKIVQFILDNLPQVFEVALDLLLSLASGLAEYLPVLIPAATDVVLKIINTIIEKFPDIIATAGDIVGKLAEGLLLAVGTIITAVGDLLTKMLNYFVEHKDDIIQSGKDFVTQLWQGVLDMKDWFAENFTTWIKDIWSNIWDSIFNSDVDSARAAHDKWLHDNYGWDDGTNYDWQEPTSYGQVPLSGYNSVYLPSSGYSNFGGGSVTNSVNNSRTVGDVVINVTSQGMDLGTVADELGQAIQNKLRMSGAML